jgi:hypothetical protein
LTLTILARSGFQGFSRACKNGVATGADRFDLHPPMKSAHDVESGQEAVRAFAGASTSRGAHPFGNARCQRVRCKIAAMRPACLRRQLRDQWAVDSVTTEAAAPGDIALRKGKRKQARAEQRETGCGQCQETVGDKVMIAHDAPSESMLVRIY